MRFASFLPSAVLMSTDLIALEVTDFFPSLFQLCIMSNAAIELYRSMFSVCTL